MKRRVASLSQSGGFWPRAADFTIAVVPKCPLCASVVAYVNLSHIIVVPFSNDPSVDNEVT